MSNEHKKWWIAGPSNFLAQIYYRQAGKGLLLLALPILVVIPMLCLNYESVMLFLYAVIWLMPFYYAMVACFVIRTARNTGNEYRLKRFNLAVVCIGIILVGLIASIFLRERLVRAYTMASDSMKPTLLVGERILVDRRAAARDPKRGALIIFEYPRDTEKDYIKRVVAVGGDTVQIRDKELLVNGEPAKEDYIIHIDPKVMSEGPRDSYGPVTVPIGSFFVLGDNRDHSFDSRFWGFIDKAKVKGSVRNVLWSWDRNNGVVRWDRIGAGVK